MISYVGNLTLNALMTRASNGLNFALSRVVDKPVRQAIRRMASIGGILRDDIGIDPDDEELGKFSQSGRVISEYCCT